MLRLNVPCLYTPRMALRPPRLEDASTIQSYFDDWEIIRWLRPPVPWPYPTDGAQDYLRRQIPEQGKTTLTFILALKDKDKAIGAVDLRLKQDASGQYAERGFSLSRAEWGQGLMQEATAAVTDFVFLYTPCTRILTFNAIGNTRSYRVQERQGFTHKGTRPCDPPYHNGCAQEDIWELTKEQWLAKRE